MQTKSRTANHLSHRLLSLFLRTGLLIPIGMVSIAGTALAQSFPVRPLKMVMPYSPGGPTDITARVVSEKLGDLLGQPIVIDYKPGANTLVGAEFVAKAAPDGHTLLLVSMSTVAINPATYKSLPYDVDRDFAPIALLCSYGAVVYGRGTLPVNDISGLLALAKASPGRVSYGSAGNGSQGHFGGAMLDMMAGTKMTHVPYKGAAPAMTDVVAGRIDFLITGVTPAWTEFVKSGKLKMLATGGIKRSSEFPSIPTVAETLPGFLNGTIFSLFTRAGLPNAVLMRLNSETNRALKSPEVKGRLEGLGFDVPADSTPESLAQLVASEKARYIKLVREAKIEIE